LHAQVSEKLAFPKKAQKQFYAIEINDVLCEYTEEDVTQITKNGIEFIQIVEKVTVLQSVLGGEVDIEMDIIKIRVTKMDDVMFAQNIF